MQKTIKHSIVDSVVTGCLDMLGSETASDAAVSESLADVVTMAHNLMPLLGEERPLVDSANTATLSHYLCEGPAYLLMPLLRVVKWFLPSLASEVIERYLLRLEGVPLTENQRIPCLQMAMFVDDLSLFEQHYNAFIHENNLTDENWAFSLMSVSKHSSFRHSILDGIFKTEGIVCERFARCFPLSVHDTPDLILRLLVKGYYASAHTLLDRYQAYTQNMEGVFSLQERLKVFRMIAIYEPASSVYEALSKRPFSEDEQAEEIRKRMLRWLALRAGRTMEASSESALKNLPECIWEIQYAIYTGVIADLQEKADHFLKLSVANDSEPGAWLFTIFSDVVLYLFIQNNRREAVFFLQRVERLYQTVDSVQPFIKALYSFMDDDQRTSGLIYLDAMESVVAWQAPYRAWFLLLAARAFSRCGESDLEKRVIESLRFMACAPLTVSWSCWQNLVDDPAIASLFPALRNTVLWDEALKDLPIKTPCPERASR